MQTVVLPAAPKTASPVPHLTSIHSTVKRGPYGDWRYPGNCSGQLIKDLLLFFEPKLVFDPMSGSGTCGDVCRELGIDCISFDIRRGQDATDPYFAATAMKDCGPFDFVWMHPPYWRMKKYSDSPGDLSNAASLEDFQVGMRRVLRNCRAGIAPGGKIAVLMGDYFDHRSGRMAPCVQVTKNAAMREGLWPACTDIIRFQHGNTSSLKEYSTSFIPGLHDTCVVFQQS